MPFDGNKAEKWIFWILQLVMAAGVFFVVGYFRLWVDKETINPQELEQALTPALSAIEQHAAAKELHMPLREKQEMFYTRREAEELNTRVGQYKLDRDAWQVRMETKLDTLLMRSGGRE